MLHSGSRGNLLSLLSLSPQMPHVPITSLEEEPTYNSSFWPYDCCGVLQSCHSHLLNSLQPTHGLVKGKSLVSVCWLPPYGFVCRVATYGHTTDFRFAVFCFTEFLWNRVLSGQDRMNLDVFNGGAVSFAGFAFGPYCLPLHVTPVRFSMKYGTVTCQILMNPRYFMSSFTPKRSR